MAAGSIEARHSVVAHRRHLKRTNVLGAKVTNINHAEKVATITPPMGEPYEFAYDQIVVTAGAVFFAGDRLRSFALTGDE